VNHSTLREIAAIADPIDRARALGGVMAEQQGLVEEAARMRRQAIAEARATGHRLEEIANVLGVSPGRISQMRKGPVARAPKPPAGRAPRVAVHLGLPAEPVPDTGDLHVAREHASERVAESLRVRPGDEVIARRRTVFAEDVPVRIATSYFRADLFGDTRLAKPEAVRPSLQEAIVALGHMFGRAEETVTARPATRAESSALDLDPGEWVVQVLRTSYSADDTPVRALEIICAATRHILTIGQVGAAKRF
jgi:GntR family transcriptional regulator